MHKILHKTQNALLSLSAIFALGLQQTWQPAWALSVQVSPIGYHPNGPKIVVLKDVPENANLRLRLVDPSKSDFRSILRNKVVYEATQQTIIPASDNTTSDAGPRVVTVLVDFADFKQPGTYQLMVEGNGISTKQTTLMDVLLGKPAEPDKNVFKTPKETAKEAAKQAKEALEADILLEPVPITFSDFVFWDTLKTVMRPFYFQRCGQNVEDTALGFSHLACHVHDAILPDGPDRGTELNLTGGWHVGGNDYNKQTSATSLALAPLLALYESSPKAMNYFKMDYPFSEEGAGNSPDLLYEAQQGLDWLLRAQDPLDGTFMGGVKSSLPSLKPVLPEADDQQRDVITGTPKDTAMATAVLAMAARTYQKKGLGMAVKTLLGAEKGWRGLQAQYQEKSQAQCQKKPQAQCHGGKMLDAETMPAAVWAAAELYLATGKPVYQQFFVQHVGQVPLEAFSAQNPDMQGFLQGIIDYLTLAKQPDAATGSALKKPLKALAETLTQTLSQEQQQLYRLNKPEDISPVALLQTMHSLLLLDSLLPAEERQAHATLMATTVLNLFGLNPLGVSFISTNTVTANSSNSLPKPLLAQASKKALPGFVTDATRTPATALTYNALLAYVLGSLNTVYNAAQAPETVPVKQPDIQGLPVGL